MSNSPVHRMTLIVPMCSTSSTAVPGFEFGGLEEEKARESGRWRCSAASSCDHLVAIPMAARRLVCLTMHCRRPQCQRRPPAAAIFAWFWRWFSATRTLPHSHVDCRSWHHMLHSTSPLGELRLLVQWACSYWQMGACNDCPVLEMTGWLPLWTQALERTPEVATARSRVNHVFFLSSNNNHNG